jgi:hypothetical protein
LGRQERGGIDYWSRSDFVLLLGLSLFRLVSGSSSLLATAGGLAAAARIFATATRVFATAGHFAAITAVLLAATLAEDAVQQTHAATLLAALHFAAGSFAATSRIFTAAAGIFATTNRLFAAVRLAAALGAAVLLGVQLPEQVQQRSPAAFLAAGLLATYFATAARILAAVLLAAVAVAGALLALLAASEQVQQRCPAALRLAGHTARIASSLAAAAGPWIITRRVTTGHFLTATVVVRSEHSVE